MKKSFLLAGVILTCAGGPAMAQNDTMGMPSAGAMSEAPAPAMQPGTAIIDTNPLPDTGSAPNRQNSDFGALSPGGSNTNPGLNAPTTTRNADTTETRAPLQGANGFTEKQAIRRIESQGYSDVSNLTKDDQSVWRGTAMKDDQQVSVALDYRGNVTAQPK